MSQHRPYILSLDQGGHSTRAIVFDSQGDIISAHKKSMNVLRPQPGFVEQDAVEVLNSFHTVLQQLREDMGEEIAHIRAAALATQRSNSVCWNSISGQPLSPLISWQDTRTKYQLQQYSQNAKWYHEKTGLYLTAHYGASKFDWCLRELPAVAEARKQNALYWGPLASFLVYHLSREKHFFVDPANASRSLLMNLSDLHWDPALLKQFHLEPALLPQIKPTVFDYGKLIDLDIPLRVVCGDQSAALYAYAKPKPDTVYINIGTGAFLQYFTGAEVKHVDGLLSGVAAQFSGVTEYTLEATVNGAGSALTFVEDELGMDYSLAQSRFSDWLSRDADLPLFLNGVSGLGSPYWQADFQSRFINTPGLGSEDWQKIVAVAESILFLIQMNLLKLKEAGLPIKQIWVTGGLAGTDALCQRLADICAVDVARPKECEATARGIAALAMDLPDAWSQTSLQHFTPKPNPALQQRFEHWMQAMQKALQAA